MPAPSPWRSGRKRLFNRAQPWIAFLIAACALSPCAANARTRQCEFFQLSDAGAPEVVQDYLNRFNKSSVFVCGPDEPHAYFEDTEPVKDGDTCHYSEYELKLSTAKPRRLEHHISSQQIYMLLTKSICPSPIAGRYTATGNVEKSEVLKIIQTWQDAVSSPNGFHRFFGISKAVATQLNSQIADGKGGDLTIAAISTGDRFWLWRNYELSVRDPGGRGQIYFVTVTSWFGKIYTISNINFGMT